MNWATIVKEIIDKKKAVAITKMQKKNLTAFSDIKTEQFILKRVFEKEKQKMHHDVSHKKHIYTHNTLTHTITDNCRK